MENKWQYLLSYILYIDIYKTKPSLRFSFDLYFALRTMPSCFLTSSHWGDARPRGTNRGTLANFKKRKEKKRQGLPPLCFPPVLLSSRIARKFGFFSHSLAVDNPSPVVWSPVEWSSSGLKLNIKRFSHKRRASPIPLQNRKNKTLNQHIQNNCMNVWAKFGATVSLMLKCFPCMDQQKPIPTTTTAAHNSTRNI